MARLFGTDGVRGLANAEADGRPGAAARAALPQPCWRRMSTRSHGRAVVGRDPRASGEMLDAAVSRADRLGCRRL